MNFPEVIHTAAWVVPVEGEPIKYGAVAVDETRIIAVGLLSDLEKKYPGIPVKNHADCIITPALVNAHIHLELSYAQVLSQGQRPHSFTGWIESLLSYRDTSELSPEEKLQAAINAADEQFEGGVSVIADIGNTDLGAAVKRIFPGKLFAFKEYLGFSTAFLQSNLDKLARESPDTLCSAHAPYSTNPQLIQAVKKRSLIQAACFPIHCAEPEAERDFLVQGAGEMVSFLKNRGFWDEDIGQQLLAKQLTGSVSYLNSLEVLDEKTLCVHAVHVSEKEIKILADKQVKVCLCPGSNKFLGVGRAPVKALLDSGILPCLGTDSHVSNPEVSLWREMQLLQEDHENIAPESIFAMATKGGADALEAHHYGSLVPGKSNELLAVPFSRPLKNKSAVYNYLVQTGSSLRPLRLS